MDTATYKYYVDWDNDGYFAHAYSDVSEYVLLASWGSGRPGAPPEYDIAGFASLKLDNSTAIFSSYNASSPIYGRILPNLRIKITMQIGEVAAVTMWQGHLEKIQPTVQNPTDISTAELTAYGVLSQFQEGETEVALQENITTSDALQTFLTADGFPVADRDIDTGLTTLSKWWVRNGTSRLQAMRELQDAEFGRLREGKDGKIIFEARDRHVGSPAESPESTYGTGTLNIWNIRQLDPLAGIYNLFRGSVRTFNQSEGGVTLAILSDVDNDLGSTPLIVPAATGSPAMDGELTVWIEFPTPSSASEYIAVKEWGIVDYEANTAADGSGTDITSDVSAVKTEYGSRLKIVFTNANASAAHMIVLRAHGIATVESDPIPVRAENSASQTIYRKREYPCPSNWLTDASDAQDHADHIIASFKDPRPRMSFDVIGNYDLTHLAEVQAREIGDRIHVTAGADFGLYIDADFIIDRLAHRVDEARIHVMTIECTIAPTEELAATGTEYTAKTIGASEDDGNPSGASNLEILTYEQDPHIPIGSVVFQFNAPTSNNRTTFEVMCVLKSIYEYACGPYFVNRNAHPMDVLETGTCIIRGSDNKIVYIPSRAADPNAVGRVLVIWTEDSPLTESDLEGNSISEEWENHVKVNRAFKRQGTFSYAIIKRWWDLNEGGLIDSGEADATGADLVNDVAEWTPDALIDYIVENRTDGSWGIITDNTEDTVVATLQGGVLNSWTVGDSFVIRGAESGNVWVRSYSISEIVTSIGGAGQTVWRTPPREAPYGTFSGECYMRNDWGVSNRLDTGETEIAMGGASGEYMSNMPWINVKDAPYNAQGDGISDDRAAIQAAYDAAASNRALVIMPSGRYLISSKLVLDKPGVMIRNMGMPMGWYGGTYEGGSSLDDISAIVGSGHALVEISARDVVLENIGIFDNAGSADTIGIDVVGSDRYLSGIHIRGCHVLAYWDSETEEFSQLGIGIRFTGIDQPTIEQKSLIRGWDKGIWPRSIPESSVTCTDVRITDSKIDGCQYGLYIPYVGPGNTPFPIWITNSIIQGNSICSIYNQSSQLTMMGNHFEGVSGDGQTALVHIVGGGSLLSQGNFYYHPDAYDYLETTLTATASAEETTLSLADASGVEVGHQLTVYLDDGSCHRAEITDRPGSPPGNDVVIATGLPSQATSGNAVLISIGTPELLIAYDTEPCTSVSDWLHRIEVNNYNDDTQSGRKNDLTVISHAYRYGSTSQNPLPIFQGSGRAVIIRNHEISGYNIGGVDFTFDENWRAIKLGGWRIRGPENILSSGGKDAPEVRLADQAFNSFGFRANAGGATGSFGANANYGIHSSYTGAIGIGKAHVNMNTEVDLDVENEESGGATRSIIAQGDTQSVYDLLTIINNARDTILGGINHDGIFYVTASKILFLGGTYSNPEGQVTASQGSFYLSSTGGSGATLWIKESGGGNTGWKAIAPLTSPLPIASGGTGATTSSDARTNLDVYSKAEVDAAIAAALSDYYTKAEINGALAGKSDVGHTHLFADETTESEGHTHFVEGFTSP